jgi:TldD protein
VFIHEMCGHLLEGSFVAQGHSPFAEKISTRIASELLNVCDDPSLAEGFGSHLIDDEGQATGPVHLIRNGVLTTFLTNDVTGRLLGLPSTASARREDFRYPATPRMSNTYIPAGDAACDASTMIAELPQGLFAQRLGRGQVNHQTGQFALEVREGMWIDRGRPVYAIKPLWIVGQASQTLMHIQAIGHDFALAPVMCKSVSGSLPVGVGIPSLLVNQLYLTASTDFHL